MRKISLALLIAVPLAAGVLDINTVTVTATRPLNLSPDQVLLYVTLTTTEDAGLDDVLAKLKPAGITAASLANVSQTFVPLTGNPFANQVPPLTQWTFLVPVPLSKMKDTLTPLAQLQSSLGTFQGSPALTYSIAGTRISADAQAAQPCPLPALVADARKQADSMAAAAGMQTGAIVSVSDGTSVDGTVPFAVPAAVSRIGDFSQFLSSSTLFGVLTSPVLIGSPQPVVIGSPQPACSLTVQFTLHP